MHGSAFITLIGKPSNLSHRPWTTEAAHESTLLVGTEGLSWTQSMKSFPHNACSKVNNKISIHVSRRRCHYHSGRLGVYISTEATFNHT